VPDGGTLAIPAVAVGGKRQPPEKGTKKHQMKRDMLEDQDRRLGRGLRCWRTTHRDQEATIAYEHDGRRTFREIDQESTEDRLEDDCGRRLSEYYTIRASTTSATARGWRSVTERANGVTGLLWLVRFYHPTHELNCSGGLYF
jgi:hypothetical protein